MKLSKRQVDILTALSHPPADAGARITPRRLAATMPDLDERAARDALRELEAMALVAIDEDGAAALTDAGVAALRSV